MAILSPPLRRHVSVLRVILPTNATIYSWLSVIPSQVSGSHREPTKPNYFILLIPGFNSFNWIWTESQKIAIRAISLIILAFSRYCSFHLLLEHFLTLRPDLLAVIGIQMLCELSQETLHERAFSMHLLQIRTIVHFYQFFYKMQTLALLWSCSSLSISKSLLKLFWASIGLKGGIYSAVELQSTAQPIKLSAWLDHGILGR